LFVSTALGGAVGVLVKQKEQAIGSEGNGNQWERGKEGKKKDKKMKRTSKKDKPNLSLRLDSYRYTLTNKPGLDCTERNLVAFLLAVLSWVCDSAVKDTFAKSRKRKKNG
jgi:hypothetical protein